MREGIVRVLEDGGHEVVAVAGDATDLIRKARAHKPDLVVTDIQMPPDSTDDGIRAAKQIREELPSTGVLVLSQFLEARYALDLVGEQAAGVGYLLKDRVGDVGEFVATLRRVAGGGSALDPEVVSRLLASHREEGPLRALSPREREVLQLVAEGRSNKGIGDRLAVSERAVQKHVTAIFAKFGLAAGEDDNRRILAVLAYVNR